MGRKYYRRYRRSRDKYSVEQRSGVLATDADHAQTGAVVVPASATEGMRKVKHLTVSLASNGGGSSSVTAWYALVYVPQGTGIGNINVDGSSMYEPNQFVMSCGVMDFDAGPCRIHSPLSRNLNSGDQIVLIVRIPTATTYSFLYTVKYAITLQ